MKRRHLLSTVALASVAGCTSIPNPLEDNTSGESAELEPVDHDEVPEDVRRVEPLAGAFIEEIQTYFADARVFITHDGEIAMEYLSEQEDPDAFERETHQIADLFADLVDEYEPTTLFIISSEVKVVVPEVSVEQYANGELEEDAFYETISFMEASR